MPDPRDGQVYKTITIGGSIWFAENLNYMIPGSYAYRNEDRTRKITKLGIDYTFGLFYTREAAMKACPNGWHLSSNEDWIELINNFGGVNEAGKALKSEQWWQDNGNGKNTSGFTGLPAGWRSPEGNAPGYGFVGYWWTSSTDAPAYRMDPGNSRVSSTEYEEAASENFFDSGFSVRCVRN